MADSSTSTHHFYGAVSEAGLSKTADTAVSERKSWWQKWGSAVILSAIAVNTLLVGSVVLFPEASTELVARNFGAIEEMQFSSANEYGDTKEGKFAYPFLGE